MITISPLQLIRAYELYDFHNLNNSETKGKGEVYGAIGEIVTLDYLQSVYGQLAACKVTSYDYDLVWHGQRVEVKSKKTSVIPKQEYNCTVSTHNTKQECDLYVFVRVHQNLNSAWILGSIKRNDFYAKAIFKERGSQDITGFIQMTGYHLPIKELEKI